MYYTYFIGAILFPGDTNVDQAPARDPKLPARHVSVLSARHSHQRQLAVCIVNEASVRSRGQVFRRQGCRAGGVLKRQCRAVRQAPRSRIGIVRASSGYHGRYALGVAAVRAQSFGDRALHILPGSGEEVWEERAVAF